MDIAQFGCFDVANYGDLLMPLVARRRLAGHRIVAVAPLGGILAQWPDAVPAARADATLQQEFRCDACLIGGGDIIRTDAADIDAYGLDGVTASFALPSLWLGAGLVAGRTGGRLLWNAPAVPAAITSTRTRALVAALLAASDYVSVCDATSRSRLLDCANGEATIRVIPDTILDVARLWPRESLLPRFETLVNRIRRKLPERAITFHLRARQQQSATVIADAVTQMAQASESLPILLAGDTAGDDGALARAVAAGLPIPHLLLDRPSHLRDVAACLAASDIYVGSDRHAFLSSFAYGNRGLLIDAVTPPWLDSVMPPLLLPVATCPDWTKAPGALNTLYAEKQVHWTSSLQAARNELDAHWRRIEACLTLSASDRAAQRQEFIGAVAADNAESPGWTVLLGGIVDREAARLRPAPVADLLGLPFQLIQGSRDHAKRQGNQLLIHPPASGRTEISLDPIPLCGGDVIAGTVLVGHVESDPVQFDFLLVGGDGSMLATTQVVALAKEPTQWRLSVRSGFSGTGTLLVATSMANPGSAPRFAWAFLVEARLDPAGSAALSERP